jgi:hypothetical protein
MISSDSGGFAWVWAAGTFSDGDDSVNNPSAPLACRRR